MEKVIPTDEDLYLAKEKFTTVLINALENELKRVVSCRWDGRSFLLQAENQFQFNIDKVMNSFYISGVISGLEQHHYSYFLQNTVLQKTAMTLRDNSITVNLDKKLSNSNFDHLLINEKKELLDCIVDFVLDLLSFKRYCYENRKVLSSKL